MKKLLAVLLACVLAVSLLACTPQTPSTGDEPSKPSIVIPDDPPDGPDDPDDPPDGPDDPDDPPDEPDDPQPTLTVKRRTLIVPTGRKENVEATAENTEETLDYKSGDETVATVDAEGNVAGVAAGSTTVTVKCGDLTEVCQVTVGARVKSVRAAEMDTSRYVNTFGRNYVESGMYKMEYVASGFETAFYGSSLSAEFTADAEAYLVVYVDDAETETVKLVKDEKKIVKLFEAAEKGEHTVKVLKRVELTLASVGMSSVKTEDGYLLPAPERKARKIEVFGDSITSGYGSLGANGTAMNASNSDGLNTYAAVAARAVNAELQAVSYSGYGLYTSRWNDGLVPSLFGKTTQNHAAAWDFTRYVPDVVIVNLGTNDGANVEGNARPDMPVFTAKDYIAAYKEFIAEIQAAYPKVKIVCCFGLMGNASYDSIKTAIAGMCAEYDASVDYLFFDKVTSAEMGCASHPNLVGHAKAGAILAAKLETMFAD